MIKIYHNPRCSKSRKGLEILENSKKPFQIIRYLETIPSEEELTTLVHLLKTSPIDLVRKNEAIWKTFYKGKKLNDIQIIKAMVKYPKLIERPIVINNQKAVIGRPPSKIEEII